MEKYYKSKFFRKEPIFLFVLITLVGCKSRFFSVSQGKHSHTLDKPSVLVIVINEPPSEETKDSRFYPLDQLSKQSGYHSISLNVLDPLREIFKNGKASIIEFCKRQPVVLVTNELLSGSKIQICDPKVSDSSWSEQSFDLKEILNFLGQSEFDLALSSTDRINRRDFLSIHDDYQFMLLSDRDVFQEVVRYSTMIASKNSDSDVDVVYWSIGDHTLGYVGIPGFSYDPRNLVKPLTSATPTEFSNLKELAGKIYDWTPANLRKAKSGMDLNDFQGAFRAQSKTVKKRLKNILIGNTLGESCPEVITKISDTEMAHTSLSLTNSCFDLNSSSFLEGLYE